jgi:hypothetical protein
MRSSSPRTPSAPTWNVRRQLQPADRFAYERYTGSRAAAACPGPCCENPRSLASPQPRGLRRSRPAPRP